MARNVSVIDINRFNVLRELLKNPLIDAASVKAYNTEIRRMATRLQKNYDRLERSALAELQEVKRVLKRGRISFKGKKQGSPEREAELDKMRQQIISGFGSITQTLATININTNATNLNDQVAKIVKVRTLERRLGDSIVNRIKEETYGYTNVKADEYIRGIMENLLNGMYSLDGDVEDIEDRIVAELDLAPFGYKDLTPEQKKATGGGNK
ncbi:UNVERIFIED_CONTAM: hypothetical protein RF648_19755, partial [Kocuria sp. CPCC 205274]